LIIKELINVFVRAGLTADVDCDPEPLSNVKVTLELEFTLNAVAIFQSSNVGAPVDISRCPDDGTAVSTFLYTPIKVIDGLVIAVVRVGLSNIDAVGVLAEVVKRIPRTDGLYVGDKNEAFDIR
jgi:hypothetical protein